MDGTQYFAWIMILGLVVLIAVTVVRFGKRPLPSGTKARVLLFVPWIVWFLLQGLSFAVGSTVTRWYDTESFALVQIYRVVSILLSWGRIISLTVALVMVARYGNGKKNSDKTLKMP